MGMWGIDNLVYLYFDLIYNMYTIRIINRGNDFVPKSQYAFNFNISNSWILQELSSLRLSSHQVSLLLSSLWVQATLPENTPANFQAMAHTYSVALLFSRSKVRFSSCRVRCSLPVSCFSYCYFHIQWIIFFFQVGIQIITEVSEFSKL